MADRTNIADVAIDSNRAATLPAYELSCSQISETPCFRSKRAAITTILQWLRTGQFEQVMATIQSYSSVPNDEIRCDIIKQILNWSVVYADAATPLRFLVQNQAALKLVQFLEDDILNNFLKLMRAEGLLSHDNAQNRSIRVEKLSLLLQLDQKKVISFMEAETTQCCLTDKINTDFCLAQEKQEIDRVNHTLAY